MSSLNDIADSVALLNAEIKAGHKASVEFAAAVQKAFHAISRTAEEQRRACEQNAWFAVIALVLGVVALGAAIVVMALQGGK